MTVAAIVATHLDAAGAAAAAAADASPMAAAIVAIS